MNFFETIIYLLEATMETPKPFGFFHLTWIVMIFISIYLLSKIEHNEKNLKRILFSYGIIALILELLKQLIHAFTYDTIKKIVLWEIKWHVFPFQLCSTPIYISILCACLKNTKIRKALLSYLSYICILGSIATLLIPTSVFVSNIEMNIHTMWLHCGSLVVAIYLLMSGHVEIDKRNLKHAYFIFLIFVIIAQMMNIGMVHSGILNGQVFDMFYISPYFITNIPIVKELQLYLPHLVYVFIYILGIGLCSYLVYHVGYYFKRKISVNNMNVSI